MKKINQIISERPLLAIGVTLVVGLLLGWMFFGGNGSAGSSEVAIEEHDHLNDLIHTCSMHPQIRNEGPGSCPICGMDLIPVETNSDEDLGEHAIVLSASAIKLAEVETSIIEKRVASNNLLLSGKIKADERRVMELTAHFPGRIEKLFVNYTGQKVYKGQVLAKVFSSELITAQKELFEAIKLKATNPKYYTSARNKFKLWLFTESQINMIEQSGEVQFTFDIVSHGNGTVTQKNISMGDHIMEGKSMFQIIDLSNVWVEFDAYESDIPWIKKGSTVDVSVKSVPGKVFNSSISFIDPVLNESSRTTVVRAELKNKSGQLRPGMFVKGSIKSELSTTSEVVLVPKSAVLWTGKNSVVYVNQVNGGSSVFYYREITLGEEAGNFYVVVKGLHPGEVVVTNGAFKIDAAAQLNGSASMMNPEGGKQSLGAHEGMDMDKL